MAKDPYLRPMYRGSNIDALVRGYVAGDPELTMLQGRSNFGPDFINPQTGIKYDMTTQGAFTAHQRSYGQNLRFLDTGTPPRGLPLVAPPLPVFEGGGGGSHMIQQVEPLE